MYWYWKDGKLKNKKIPKNNNKVPKTKRLRKKKMWALCDDCRIWMKTYKQTTGTLVDGSKICHSCLKERIKQSRAVLFK